MAILFVNDKIRDNGLQYLIDNADKQVLCEGQPATYEDATTDKGSGGVALGETTPTFTGPQDAQTDGREVQINAAAGVIVDVTGVTDYDAIVDDTNSELLAAVPRNLAEITAVDTTTNTVTLSGDVTADISAGDYITIRESTGNDGIYTVSSVTLNVDVTEVVTNEAIADATADGYCIYGAIYVQSGGDTVSIAAYSIINRDATLA
jgi:hypothetical protein